MTGYGGITHRNFYKLKTLEFRKIERLKDDPQEGEYSDFGYIDQAGQIGSFDGIIERVHGDGDFTSLAPESEFRPMAAPPDENRSHLSFLNNGQKTLHVLKLSGESNLVFDPDMHPVQVAMLDSYGAKEMAMIPRLFSDCRFLYFDEDGDLEPRIPGEHKHQHEWVQDTQWACFVFNGLLAKRLSEEWGMKFSFHFHVINRITRLAPHQELRLAEVGSKIQHDENPIKIMHPPYWPGHHKPDIVNL